MLFLEFLLRKKDQSLQWGFTLYLLGQCYITNLYQLLYKRSSSTIVCNI